MEISSILQELLSALDGLNDENFEATMGVVNAKKRRIDEIKLQLKSTYEPEMLSKYEPGLIKLTKQLSNKFDNIITKVKTEQNAIGLELKNIQNKKKLVNYNR
ncbi:MAG: hypothetical protein HF312_05795 [Ignavibacteria bacterium]|nr:hypothetical protein [Ignavibacteria bacterium]MCU7519711.1 hypothetical protein [Ignavibacteria bacterium]